jgi:hypothetical protein
VIEPVEVHRVYPLVAVDGANAVAVPDHAPPNSATDILVVELREMMASMRQAHERTLGDLQRDRDEWRDQAARALGTGAEAETPAPVPAPTPMDARRPLYRAWRWMRRRDGAGPRSSRPGGSGTV